MTYLVNEIFYSVQGEGYWTGRPAVFCRFSRCNLWTGREADRHRAVCQFCDTDFAEATKYSDDDLIDAIAAAWPDGRLNERMVIFTGGEPALQINDPITEPLGMADWYLAIETNGTIPLPRNTFDWICVSPKAGAPLNQTSGDELKLVWPQPFDLDRLWWETNFGCYWLSPMDGPNLAANTAGALQQVLADPRWRLNIQTHKVIGAR